MANAVKWSAGWSSQGTSVLTPNSLSNNSRTDRGSEYDNAANKNQYGCLEINLDFDTSTPSAGAYIKVFKMKQLDGTNWDDGSSSVEPAATTLLAVIPVRAASGAHNYSTGLFALPPTGVAFIIENQTGQSTKSSGNTVYLYVANDEIQ